MDRTEVVEIVLEALRAEMTTMEEQTTPIESVGEDTPLLGDGAPIDSFGLVSVIVQVEESLAAVGAWVSLVDEKAMSLRNSPFGTVRALANYAFECAERAVE